MNMVNFTAAYQQNFTLFNNQTIFDKLNFFDLFLLSSAICIFIVGIIGNLLVIIVVIKNSHMRTITNIFIVNLAIGDFLVILICLPPSVLQDLTKNWWFGESMCRIIPFVQVSLLY